MHEVKIEKDRLRTRVAANRAKHAEQFSIAIKGYQVELLQGLERNLQLAKDDARHRVKDLPVAPDDHTPDYDRVLSMIDYSADDHLTLDETQFRQFVEDDWNWKVSWSASNAKYLGR